MMAGPPDIAIWWSVGAWDQMLKIQPRDIAERQDRARILQYLLAAASFAGSAGEMAAYAEAGKSWGVIPQDMAAAVLSGRELCLALYALANGDEASAKRHIIASSDAFAAQAEQTALLDMRMVQLMQRAHPRPSLPVPQLLSQTACQDPRVVQREVIGPVLDLFPINNADGYGGFPFVESGGRFICAWYDRERRLTLAARTGDGPWETTVLDQQVGWDSHNYIALEVDADGLLHLCGNMHVSALVYYRSTQPLDIHSMVRIPSMTGDRETRVTYPKFFFLNDGRLCFSYRDGHSGNGNILINVYSTSSRSWTRMLQNPLLDGEGLRNAYVYGPVHGPDGYFHLCWVWRGTINAETSHVLAYARSRDLLHWEDGTGQPLPLPMTFTGSDVVADLPMGSGIINNNNLIGFDNNGRPVITYHRFDEHGHTQIFAARRDVVGWSHQQLTAWNYRWEFAGNGSLSFEVTLFPPYALGNGMMAQEYDHRVYGRGTLIIRDTDLHTVAYRQGSLCAPADIFEQPDAAIKQNISFRWSDMVTRDSFYMLLWQSHPENRDRASENEPIADNQLEVLNVERGQMDFARFSAQPVAPQPAPDAAFLHRGLSDLRTEIHDLRFRLQAETHYRKEIETRFRKRR